MPRAPRERLNPSPAQDKGGEPVIGAFARKFGKNETIVQVDELEDDSGYKIQSQGPEGARTTVAADAGPKAFMEELEHEGGSVFVVPLLEALMDTLRARVRSGKDGKQVLRSVVKGSPTESDQLGPIR